MAGKLDTENVKVGQNQTKEISGSGEAEVISDSGIEAVPAEDFNNLAELEKFMNDPIELMIYEPMEEGSPAIVMLKVNGISQYVIRGRTQTIKRKYVEVLARARKQHVTARGFKTANGDAKNTVNITSGLEYPFQVLNDPSPKGPSWLKGILAEA